MILPMWALYIANASRTPNICGIIEFFEYTLTNASTLYCKCELDTNALHYRVFSLLRGDFNKEVLSVGLSVGPSAIF